MSHPYLLVWILNTPIWIFHYWIISQEIHTDKKHDFNSVANDLCLVRENFFLLCVLWGIYLHTYGRGVQHDPVSMISTNMKAVKSSSSFLNSQRRSFFSLQNNNAEVISIIKVMKFGSNDDGDEFVAKVTHSTFVLIKQLSMISLVSKPLISFITNEFTYNTQ